MTTKITIAPVREDDLLELLAPYTSWAPRRLPDPRTARIAEVASGLVSIVAAEGPVLDHRVFRLYTRAAGLGRASADVRCRYGEAVAQAVRERRIAAEPDGAGPGAMVLRPAGAPPVRLRERKDRTLEEIPLAEITALIRKLELTRGEAYASPEERHRRALEVYELLRLTAKSRARLETACAMANLPNWSRAITENHEPEPALPGRKPRRHRPRLRHG